MSPEVLGVLMALGAGLCTTIGGACVFFVTKFQRLPLAVCMAVSAGVMAYVSFVEIFPESRTSIHEGLVIRWNKPMDDKNTESWAYLFATICLFGGWWIATLMDIGIDFLITKFDLEGTANIEQPTIEGGLKDSESIGVELGVLNDNNSENHHQNDCSRADCDAEEGEKAASKSGQDTAGSSTPTEGVPGRDYSQGEHIRRDSKVVDDQRCWLTGCLQWDPTSCLCCKDKPAKSESRVWELAHADECFRRDQRRFLRMGVFTAFALTLHNLPEGVATFTGALASEKLGASVAIAIGIHNIPEGFAVSVPLFFGTGKKWSSFFYSIITGFAEPIGALIAWAILGGRSDPLALGIAFGVVCGIMTNIALKELLPAAFKYDPCNQVTTKSFVIGMLVMALSLCLFEFK